MRVNQPPKIASLLVNILINLSTTLIASDLSSIVLEIYALLIFKTKKYFRHSLVQPHEMHGCVTRYLPTLFLI